MEAPNSWMAIETLKDILRANKPNRVIIDEIQPIIGNRTQTVVLEPSITIPIQNPFFATMLINGSFETGDKYYEYITLFTLGAGFNFDKNQVVVTSNKTTLTIIY